MTSRLPARTEKLLDRLVLELQQDFILEAASKVPERPLDYVLLDPEASTKYPTLLSISIRRALSKDTAPENPPGPGGRHL